MRSSEHPWGLGTEFPLLDLDGDVDQQMGVPPADKNTGWTAVALPQARGANHLQGPNERHRQSDRSNDSAAATAHLHLHGTRLVRARW